MSCHDIQAVAYQNAMLSQAGSLRKAHDVPTWLMKLKLLQQKGLAAEEAIKKWNQQATKEAQLQGQKRTCLLNLLNCPEPIGSKIEKKSIAVDFSSAD